MHFWIIKLMADILHWAPAVDLPGRGGVGMDNTIIFLCFEWEFSNPLEGNWLLHVGHKARLATVYKSLD